MMKARPDYKVMYELLLRLHVFGDISPTAVSKELNCSKATVYKYSSTIESDIHSLKTQK